MKGKRGSRKRQSNNVSAETIIKRNIDSLSKKSYNSAPKKGKRAGRTAFDSQQDLALINDLFVPSAQSKSSTCEKIDVHDVSFGLSEACQPVGKSLRSTSKSRSSDPGKIVKVIPLNGKDPDSNNFTASKGSNFSVNNTKFIAEGRLKDESLNKFNARVDAAAKMKEASLPSIRFNPRRKEKLKKLDNKRAEAKLNQKRIADERRTDKEALRVKEYVPFGEVVDRPPLDLKKIIDKKNRRLQTLGNKFKTEDNLTKPLSTLPNSVVEKLAGSDHLMWSKTSNSPNDVTKLSKQAVLTQRVQQAYRVLREKRHTNSIARGKIPHKLINKSHNKSVSVNQCNLSFPLNQLYHEKTGKNQWVGKGKFFEPESF